MSIFRNIFKKRNESGFVNQIQQKQYVPNFDNMTEFGDINSIFKYVVNADMNIAQKAAETIHRLLNNINTFRHKELYENFKYIKIDKSDIENFERFPQEIKVSLLCVTTLNENGYTREKALIKLTGIKEEKVVPFVLFRLADWVQPIREKAENIVEEYLTEGNTVFLIQNHKLINWLLSLYRKNLSSLHNKIINSITNKRLDKKDLLILNDGERFFYYKSLFQNKKFDEELTNQILNDKYYLVRLLLIDNLKQIKEPKEIIFGLLTDKSQKIRQKALNFVSQQNLKDYQSFLELLIYDNSAFVRFESRKLLAQIGTWDFREVYKESISRSENLTGSILGLSEIGNINDIPVILKFLNSDKVKVKTASLIGVYNIDKDIATAKSYEILSGLNPISTKKAAEYVLINQGVDIMRLRQMYDLADFTSKKIILKLINIFGGWSSAGDFIKALTEDNDNLKNVAIAFLESWNRYTMKLFTKQTQEEKDYVLLWYEIAQTKGINLSDEIPFIFGKR